MKMQVILINYWVSYKKSTIQFVNHSSILVILISKTYFKNMWIKMPYKEKKKNMRGNVRKNLQKTTREINKIYIFNTLNVL